MAQTSTQRTVSLASLLDGIAAAPADVAVTDIALDSRSAIMGGAFLACRGIKSHGLQYVDRAVANGVRAVLWEPAPGVAEPQLPSQVFVLAVPELSRHLGAIADRFFESPSKQVRIAGITGTNGKTTSAWLLAQALEHLGLRGGYSGTLGSGVVSKHIVPAAHTTPDCISVHRSISDLHSNGVRSLAMEVSSHALEQHRIDGVCFNSAAFTNLSRDHLDYHATMEAYGDAKARLFMLPGLEHRIVNVGDAFGRDIVERLPANAALTAMWVGPSGLRGGVEKFVNGHAAVAGSGGLEVKFESSWGAGVLRSQLIGDFNAENLMTALAILLSWEVPLARAVAALEKASAPPGRMETFVARGRPLAVVDYAHTPDALTKALRAVRAHTQGKVWCVFGCGGDRDTGKRPLMGSIAAQLADEIVLTDDNPRSEDADGIVRDIAAGIGANKHHRVIRDRAEAIATALNSAQSQDVVLIAGKGHENYQLYGSRALPFSDRDEVRRLQAGVA